MASPDPCCTASLDVPADAIQNYDGLTYVGVRWRKVWAGATSCAAVAACRRCLQLLPAPRRLPPRPSRAAGDAHSCPCDQIFVSSALRPTAGSPQPCSMRVTVQLLHVLPTLAPPLHCVQHMMAGAVAGIGEHVAMFPVDTVKTRMQALAHPGQQVRGGGGGGGGGAGERAALGWRKSREGRRGVRGGRTMQRGVRHLAPNCSHVHRPTRCTTCHFLSPPSPPAQLHTSVGTALRNILRREGVAGLYRGVAAMALGAG